MLVKCHSEGYTIKNFGTNWKVLSQGTHMSNIKALFSKSVIRWFGHVAYISGGLSSGFTCISYEKSDLLIPCPKLIRDTEISICHVLHCPSFPTPISYRVLIICFDICKTLSYSCIDVKDKHRVCLPAVMVQNTEYFGLYRDSQLCCEVRPSSRISYGAIDNSYGQC